MSIAYIGPFPVNGTALLLPWVAYMICSLLGIKRFIILLVYLEGSISMICRSPTMSSFRACGGDDPH